MNFYFYIIHIFLPNTASFQVPIYIQANDITDAKVVADDLKLAFENQFQILFPPSDPVVVHANINESRFDAFIAQVTQQNSVVINLPVNFSGVILQHNKSGQPLRSILARVMVPGSQSSVYSL